MANEFDDVLDQEPASTLPPLTSGLEKSEFDDVLDTEVTQQQSYVRNVIDIASKDNPQAAAERIQLSQRTGLPPDVVARNQQELKRREMARAIDLQRMMRDSPVLFRQMNDPTFTAAALDDLDTLKQVERTMGDIGLSVIKGAVGLPQAVVGLADIPTGGHAGKALESIGYRPAEAQKIIESAFSPEMRASLARVQNTKGFFDAIGTVVTEPRALSNTIIESLPLMLGGAGIARGIAWALPGTVGAIAAAGAGEGAIGAGSAAEQIRGETEDGLLTSKQVGAALASGVVTGHLGAFGGTVAKRLGIGDIDTALASGRLTGAPKAGFAKQVLGSGISEGLFEELPQSAQEQMWQNFALGQPILQGVVNAAAIGLVAGAATGGAFGAYNATVASAQARVDSALADAQRLQAAMAAAAKSQLRERAPETFQQLAEQMGGGSVFIDGQALAQSGIDIAQAFPSLADQVNEAAFLNSTVEIPLAEVLTAVPGTPLEELFLQNAKSSPDALSQAEVQQAGEQGQQFIQQEAERVLQQAQDRQAWQTEVDTVHQTIKGQLDQAGRFTSDVNEGYARLQSQFFSTMASRLGITPSEMYERFSLKVAGQMGQGEVLNAWQQPEFATDSADENGNLAPMQSSEVDPVADALVAQLQERGFTVTGVNGSTTPSGRSVYIPISYTPRASQNPNWRRDGRIPAYVLNTEIRVSDHGTGTARTSNYLHVTTKDQAAKVVEEFQRQAAELDQRILREQQGIDSRPNRAARRAAAREQAAGQMGQGEVLNARDSDITQFDRDTLAETDAMLEANQLDSVDSAYQYMIDDRSHGDEFLAAAAQILYPGEATGINVREWSAGVVALSNQMIADTNGDAGELDIARYQAGSSALNQSRDITQTPEFKTWFGNSKIVDAEGRPLVVYHGTNETFDVFDRTKQREGTWGKGFYFSTSEEEARNYGSNVIAVYLKADRLSDTRAGGPGGTTTGEGKTWAMKGKMLANGGDVFLVTSPTQIKSATDNSGEFDPNDPNILRQSAVGKFAVERGKDGSVTVYGDADEIRAAIPSDIKGRKTSGGIAFASSAAPRVLAALSGRQMAYSRAGAVVKKMPMKNGKYVGAPEKFNTPGKVPTLRKWLRQLTLEGAPGRYWYENSSAEILRMTGGDVQEARRFVALLSIYSPQAKVDTNGTFALRAWAQYKAGQTISVKTGVQDEKARQALADVDAFWRGEKTGNFFNNLLRMIDPSVADKQGATIDMWMMRAAQYDTDAPTATQYGFMENETNRIAQELGWEPQQVQASIWVAMKARMENNGVKERTEASSEKKGWIRFDRSETTGKEARVIIDAKNHRNNWLKHAFEHDPTREDTVKATFDFGDAMIRHIGQLSFEARPGRTSGVLPGIHTASYEQQLDFQRAVQAAFLDENGNDTLAQMLGLLVDNRTNILPGVWRGEVSPRQQQRIVMAPAQGNAGKTHVDPAQAEALNLYAAMSGLVARQEGVGWHRPFYKATKRDANGLDIRLGRALTPEEMVALERAVDEWMTAQGKSNWNDGLAFISTPTGVRLVSFGAVDNATLQGDIVQVAESVLPDFKWAHFASDGDMPTNKWQENPDGQSYIHRASAAGRSDVLLWTRDVLAPRVQQVFDDFSQRYGWGDPGRLNIAVDEDQARRDAESRAAARVGESSEQTVPRDGGAVVYRQSARRGVAPVSSDAVPGVYNARTQLVSAGTRQLGIRRVRNAADAAQALVEYLGTQAVERLDGLVTDKDGKPLAIIGNFKGTVDSSAVYPFTLAGEAFRIEGAAALWFVHNHPSGIPTLSDDDRRLFSTLRDVFDGSGIEPKGMMAIGGKTGGERTFSFTDGSRTEITDVIRPPSKTKTTVPVVERTFAHPAEIPPSSDPRMSDPAAWIRIDNPTEARSVVNKLSSGEFGVVLLDHMLAPIGFLPMDPTQVYPLREQGRSAALFRAISVANASAAIIADTGQGPRYAVENVSRALQSIGVRVLDVIPASGKGESAAETGTLPTKGRFAQPAYHGTPYRGIDKFSTDNIGTGEGAQAYGWGLYFASKREIAEYYRETLTPRTNEPVVIWDGYPITYDEINTLPGDDNLILSMVHHLISHGTAGTKQEILNATVVALKEDFSEEAGFTADWQAAVDAIADRIDVEVPNKGQLYEVDIPEDSEMLLWDKPLSEQPDAVREALGQLKTTLDTAGLLHPYLAQKNYKSRRVRIPAFAPTEKNAEWDELTGQELYRQILDRAHSDDALGLFDLGERSDQAASKYLATLGIKGIKYLDGGSRMFGEGSYNYVVFSGDDVAIRDQFYQRQQEARGTFNPQALMVSLGPQSDLSTFLHESGHFFLEVMADLASLPDAPAQIREDMEKVLAWFGVPDLATWNALTLDEKRDHHEKWAESFEQYLLEGKAPSAELQPLFRRFRSWLVNVYKSLSDFMRGRNLELNDEIRQVFDRMLATDEDVKTAEEQAGLLPDFDATNEAIERLQSRSMRALKWTLNARSKFLKQFTKEARERRVGVLAEVLAEFEQRPEVVASRAIRKVRNKEGAERDAKIAAIADATGYPTVEEMMVAVTALGPVNVAVEAEVDRRMLERHGDVSTPEALEAAANEAVHNEARARALAAELKSQDEAMNPRATTGRTDAKGRPITVNALLAAARAFGADLAARRQIGKLKNAIHLHRAAEARAGKAWQTATQKGDTKAAVQAKKDQLLNNQAVRALLDAQGEVRAAIEFFRKVTKGNNEKLVKGGRDPDVVNAMRAILGAYGIAPKTGKTALEYLELVQKNDPSMYGVIAPGVNTAMARAKPFNELTVEEVRGLTDELKSLWHLAKRSRQMEIDGDLLDLEDLADQLYARMEDLGIPDVLPGETGALTESELRKRNWLQQAPALLRRVEQWAEAKDGTFGGPFLRFIFQPVKAAADRYRTDRLVYRQRFQALVDAIAPTMAKTIIAAPELGYTFGRGHNGIGMAELLHAILHTGNDSNTRKLLLGREWATENPDGTLDTTRWDALIARLISEGTLTKAHYDFAQSVWDLMEETKPLAQKTHRDVFGRYFAEVTANEVQTPFGTYRGGYVPAQADPLLVQDADQRELLETENAGMSHAFPATNKGFTKGRVEYNRPLKLDLRTLPQHIDKVLLFSHMEPAVRSVDRLLRRKKIAQALNRIDPAAINGMLKPWLNRSARQTVETPVSADAGMNRMLSQARARTGMALMMGNLSNTLQQITGFSTALLKVKGSHMRRAVAQYIADPKQLKNTVWSLSPYMADRASNEVAVLSDTLEAILLNPSVYASAERFTRRHGYFLQTAMDNQMSPIIWTGAYNQALAEGMDDRMARRFADGVIRQTQGSTLPEDVSRIETGTAFARAFTQFIGYFNMLANTNATALQQIAQEQGLRKGAGKAFGVLMVGMMIPIWVAELIAHAMRGGPPDDDDDGYLDDWLAAVFGFGTIRGILSGVPGIAQIGQSMVNRFNDNPADDKFSLSPTVSVLESAAAAPQSVYKAIAEEGSAQKAVRDMSALITVATGLPAMTLARPLGYAAGVAQGKIEPTGPGDFARGMVTGTASPESKNP